jgi:hypothetical protein
MASMVGRTMPRIQQVVIPILKDGLRDDINVGSWVKDVSRRTYPLINVRRLGGLANAKRPDLFDRAVIELTAYSTADDPDYPGLTGTENLYLDAKHLLWQAVRNQTVVPGLGHLHSFFETMGPTQFDSPFDDTWRIQGLIQLGLRPAN